MGTLYWSGKIYCERDHFAQAVYVEKGIIKYVGTMDDATQYKEKATRIVDLQGRLMLPGFNDSHLHLYKTAQMLEQVDLRGCESLDAFIRTAQQFTEAHPELDIIQGWGWNQNNFTDTRLPSRADLDLISADKPVILVRSCLHIMAVNSKALELSGLFASIPETFADEVDVDAKGDPTGILREDAQSLIWNVIEGDLNAETILMKITKVAESLNREGITSVQINDVTVGTSLGSVLETVYEMYRQNQPTVRIRHQLCYHDLATFAEHAGDVHTDDAFLSYGPLKLFADGSLGGRTAFLKEAYADDPGNKGLAVLSREALQAYMALAEKHRRQVLIHAIGDGAIERVLDGYASVLPAGENPLRHGILHCQITDEALLQQFQQHHILAMVQPVFMYEDLKIAEARVGHALAATSYAFETMERFGIKTAYSSDAPVETFRVLEGIHAAVNRVDADGKQYDLAECVDIAAAVDAYTWGGAYVSFEEEVKGRIREGYYADFVVLEQDLFTQKPETIRYNKVVMSIIDDKIVYERTV